MSSLKLETAGKNPAWVYPEVQGANPPERWGHSACFSEGVLYVFGGCRGGLHFSDVMSLDLTTMSWKTFACTGQQPGIRDSHTAILHGRKMVVFGGTNGSKKINDVHILDLDTHVWSSPAVDGQPPPARESHSATLVDGNRMVIFGGTGEGEGNYLNDIHFLELDRMQWESPAVKGELPSCRDSHTAVAVNEQLVVYGGDCGDRYLSEVDIFNLRSFTWSKMNTTAGSVQPAVRAGHVSVAAENKVYLFGGVGDRAYYNDVWVLDVDSWKWSQIEVTGRHPQGRFSHVAVLRDDDVAIYGGCGEDERPLDEVLVLHLGIEQLNPEFPKCKFVQTVYDMEGRKPAVEVINDDGLCDGEMFASKNELTLKRSSWKTDFLKLSNQKRTLPLPMRSRTRKMPFHPLDQLDNDFHAKKRKTSNLMGRLEGIETEHDEVSPTMSQLPSPTNSEQDKSPQTSKPSRPPAIFLQHQQERINNTHHLPHPHPHPHHPQKAIRVPTLQLQLHLPGGHQTVSLPVHETPHLQPQHQHISQQQSVQQRSSTHGLVGSEVRGLIDGAFDSGYLMTAQINGQILRGVLFSPGPMHAAVHRPPLCNSHPKPGATTTTTSMASLHHVSSTPGNAGTTIVGYPVCLSNDSASRDSSAPGGGGLVHGLGSSADGLTAIRPVQILGNFPPGQSGRWIFQPSASPTSSAAAAAIPPAMAAQQALVSPSSPFERNQKKSLPYETDSSQPLVTLSLGQSSSHSQKS